MGIEEPDIERLHVAITALMRAYKLDEAGDGPVSEADLNAADLAAIALLGEAGTLKNREVAARLGVAPTTATSILDRLVRKGFVRRARSEIDRRIVEVDLSDAGSAFFARLRARQLQNCRSMLAALGEEERVVFLNLISKVAANADVDADA